MSDVGVRPVRREELARVGEITVAAYRASGLLHGDSDYEHQLRDAAGRAELAELLAAVDGDDMLLGSVTVARYGTRFAQVAVPGELEFRMLAIEPRHRGRGVGELLTQAVCDRAGALGCHRVVMCVDCGNAPALRLYERMGFRRLPERDWAPVPAVQLLALGRDVPR